MDVQKLEPLCIVGGHVKWKAVWWFLKELKIELPYDLAIPLLGIYTKELKVGTQTDNCTAMFIEDYS